jgi:probable phosphoglycerate mutase
MASFDFVRVLVSPLLRARETCDLCGLGEQAELVEDLREWDYGEYEGLTTPQIREERPDWNLWRDGCPGGESPQQVARRADRVLEVADGAAGPVALFSHGHMLRVVGARWIEQPVVIGSRLALSAGAVCVLGFERATRVLHDWNQTTG